MTAQPTAGVVLKACPMCHSDQIRLKSALGESWVRCEGCGLSTEMFVTGDQAITAWNTRAPTDAGGAVEAIQKALAEIAACEKIIFDNLEKSEAIIRGRYGRRMIEGVRLRMAMRIDDHLGNATELLRAALTSEPKAEGEGR